MTAPPPQLELHPLHIPAHVDDADAADFREMTHVRNIVYREITGSDDNDLRPDELLPHYRPAPDEIRLIWVARWNGRIVGRAALDLPLEQGSDTGVWLIELLAEVHGHGIGTAAYAVIEGAAREHGRRTLQSYAEHPNAPGPRIAAPTGFGDIPLDRRARFFLRQGYELQQIERKSALDLRAASATVDRLLDEARAASGGYRVVQWTAPTPAEHVDGYAWLKSRMSTDAPAGGMAIDEEAWDAARVQRHDARYLEAGQTLFVTAAQHVATGELVAFNELMIGSDRSRATFQEDTLVSAAHRGHRLGLLVKCAALVAWRDIAPASPRVITYNAEENRPMLDINERIGFAPLSYEGAWQKVLDAVTDGAGTAGSSATSGS
ncbi:GNAT family N-acetyltransferase [Microbacterium thalli]|uniref:GNAT family N-acetyltransferase n=1 Tax=Microbacterium thalli TaxID=3027921 RepID=UPI002366836C|nr:GNAT family N-acetyltransferase [Microbacterium thalli]MDD7929802.1 GNAT family N-acetyltransferase [Microbacterium thalli]